MDKVEFGVRVRDIVDGFEGLVTGRCEYMYGHEPQWHVEALAVDGKVGVSSWIPESRLRVTNSSYWRSDCVDS